MIQPVTFYHRVIDNFALIVAIIGALLAGKWLAAEIAGCAFGYTADARKTMWSLTLPQVASTLAAALVAFETFSPVGQRLIGQELLNAMQGVGKAGDIGQEQGSVLG